MKRLKIAVLRGGPSHESNLSVRSGRNIIDTLAVEHDVTDVIVDKDLNWYSDGIKMSQADIARKFDLVVNLIKGAYGEDGQLSAILNQQGVKYTGPKVFDAMFSYDKSKTKNVLINNNIRTPLHKVVIGKDNLISGSQEIFESMSFPLVVKPLKSGSSIGVFVVNDMPQLKSAMYSILALDDSVMVEEFIKGKDSSVFVAQDFRGQKTYSFSPVTYGNKDEEVVDYNSKLTQNFSFQNDLLSPYEKDLLIEHAKKVFESLNMRHHAVIDFRVHPRRGVYVLEANSIPVFGDNTIVGESLRTVGATDRELIEHLVDLALSGK